MSQAQDLSYDDPWPMFSDEEEPWKDLERLLKWEQKMDTQMELGDAFGCSPSTISYWLDKAKDEVEPDPDEEDLHCEFHDVCDNLAPGVNNSLCIVCLDLARHNQGELPDGVPMEEYDDRESHMEALYEEHSDFAAERQEAYDERHSDDEEDDSEDSEDES